MVHRPPPFPWSCKADVRKPALPAYANHKYASKLQGRTPQYRGRTQAENGQEQSVPVYKKVPFSQSHFPPLVIFLLTQYEVLFVAMLHAWQFYSGLR